MSEPEPEVTDPDAPAKPLPGDGEEGDSSLPTQEDDSEEAPTGSGARLAGEKLRELAEVEERRVEEELSSHPLAALGASPITAEDLDGTDYAPCPFCEGWGATEPDALLAALPQVVERLAPFPQSRTFERCSECDGWGRVLTGGRMQENGIQPCPTCDGHGYRDRRAMAEVGANGAGDGSRPPAPPPSLPDPMRLSPAQGGEPPAAGMVWFEDLGSWAYPAVAP